MLKLVKLHETTLYVNSFSMLICILQNEFLKKKKDTFFILFLTTGIRTITFPVYRFCHFISHQTYTNISTEQFCKGDNSIHFYSNIFLTNNLCDKINTFAV